MKMALHNGGFLIVLVVACLLVGNGGCGSGSGARDGTDEQLNRKQVEAALRAPEITTIRELFRHFSELDIRDISKEYLGDLAAREADCKTLDEYVAQFYLQVADIQAGKREGKDMSPDAVRRRLEKSIHWKTRPSLAGVGRVYVVQCRQPTVAERIATLDNIVYFRIFTDADGKVLGWRNIADSE